MVKHVSKKTRMKAARAFNKVYGSTAWKSGKPKSKSGLYRIAAAYYLNNGYDNDKFAGLEALKSLAYDDGDDMRIEFISDNARNEPWLDFDGTPVHLDIDKELAQRILVSMCAHHIASLETYLMLVLQDGIRNNFKTE